jgi:hypothetical protein
MGALIPVVIGFALLSWLAHQAYYDRWPFDR